MNEFQEKLLEMMAWFHSLCIYHNLRYYALGGTMLGAMRHHGFIPWDDDLDIGMPREDYQKLEAILSKLDDSKYILETPSSKAKDFCYPYSKLYDKTTTLVENQKYKIKRGLYIDVFPLDGLGNSVEEAKENYLKVEKTRNLLLLKVSAISKGRSISKNMAVCIFKLIPMNEKKLLYDVATKGDVYDFYGCKIGGNTLGMWRWKEIMPTEYMGIPQLYEFENIQIYGAEHPDRYLTHLYGDWRTPPPKEKQVTHHDFIYYDLHKSWMEK